MQTKCKLNKTLSYSSNYSIFRVKKLETEKYYEEKRQLEIEQNEISPEY